MKIEKLRCKFINWKTRFWFVFFKIVFPQTDFKNLQKEAVFIKEAVLLFKHIDIVVSLLLGTDIPLSVFIWYKILNR